MCRFWLATCIALIPLSACDRGDLPAAYRHLTVPEARLPLPRREAAAVPSISPTAPYATASAATATAAAATSRAARATSPNRPGAGGPMPCGHEVGYAASACSTFGPSMAP